MTTRGRNTLRVDALIKAFDQDQERPDYGQYVSSDSLAFGISLLQESELRGPRILIGQWYSFVPGTFEDDWRDDAFYYEDERRENRETKRARRLRLLLQQHGNPLPEGVGSADYMQALRERYDRILLPYHKE